MKVRVTPILQTILVTQAIHTEIELSSRFRRRATLASTVDEDGAVRAGCRRRYFDTAAREAASAAFAAGCAAEDEGWVQTLKAAATA